MLEIPNLRAFLSEVDAGSREEDASKQQAGSYRAPFERAPASSSRLRRREALWPIALGLAALLGLVHLSLAQAAPGDVLTVVFAPWTSRGEAITRATRNARLIATGILPGVVEVRPDSALYRPEGAWMILHGAALPPCAWEADAT